MPSCCVPGCKSRYYEKGHGIQYFSFPFKRPEQCSLWIKAIGKENWQPSKWSKICSLHFTLKDYLPRAPGVIRYLNNNAVPSQMLENLCNSPETTYQNVLSRASDSTTVGSNALPKFSTTAADKIHRLPITTETVKSVSQQNVVIEQLPHKVPNIVIKEPQTEQNVTIGSANHIIRIVAVKDSNPLLAIQCALTNKEACMILPIQHLLKNDNTLTTQIKRQRTTMDMSSDNDSDSDCQQLLIQKNKLNELSQMQVLKIKIKKLNQTIRRQKKKLNYMEEMCKKQL